MPATLLAEGDEVVGGRRDVWVAGARPRVGPMYPALETEAARVGLPLKWPARLPNTRTALAASEWVRLHRPEVSDLFNRSLFAAHFVLGEDLGDMAVVEQHASEVGVDTDAFADGSASESLAEAESIGARLGVQATPSWLMGGELVSGLLRPAKFERLAEQVTATKLAEH